jgi:hypothetical protein
MTFAGGAMIHPGSIMNTASFAAGERIDASQYKYLDFVWYVSNADAIKGVLMCIELTSSGMQDNEENSYTTTVENMKVQNGWNVVPNPITPFLGAAHPTAINFIRLLSLNLSEATGDVKIQLHSLVFTNSETLTEAPDIAVEPEESEIVETDLVNFQSHCDELLASLISIEDPVERLTNCSPVRKTIMAENDQYAEKYPEYAGQFHQIALTALQQLVTIQNEADNQLFG